MTYKSNKKQNNLSLFFCSDCDELLNEGATRIISGGDILCSQCLEKLKLSKILKENEENEENEEYEEYEENEEYESCESIREISECLKVIEKTMRITRTKKFNKDEHKISCENCKEEGIVKNAEIFCINDEILLCSQCFDLSHKHKISKSHKTMDIEQWEKKNQFQIRGKEEEGEEWFCNKHHISPLFCDEENNLICLECNGREHIGHKMRTVGKRSEEEKKRINIQSTFSE